MNTLVKNRKIESIPHINSKRMLDIAGASLALLFLAVPMLVSCILIKLTSKGSIIYKQTRVGLNGEEFEIFKFRTLYSDRCASGFQANSDDSVKTPFGKFARKYSIDELPQLFNVLRGDMSLVGPRPVARYLDEQFSSVRNLQHRYKVLPGITGLAQINGCRGETTTIEEYQKRINYDILYVKHASLLLDFKILLNTVRTVFTSNTGS